MDLQPRLGGQTVNVAVNLNPTALRRRRIALGITQERLAEQIGVHVNSLNRWEAGEYPPAGCHGDRWEQAICTAEATMLAHLERVAVDTNRRPR